MTWKQKSHRGTPLHGWIHVEWKILVPEDHIQPERLFIKFKNYGEAKLKLSQAKYAIEACILLFFLEKGKETVSTVFRVWANQLQLCPTLCDPIDCSPPGIVNGILQARILEWVPPPGNLQYLGTELLSPALQADVFTAEPSGKPHSIRVSAYLWGGVRDVKEENKKGAGCCWWHSKLALGWGASDVFIVLFSMHTCIK